MCYSADVTLGTSAVNALIFLKTATQILTNYLSANVYLVIIHQDQILVSKKVIAI